MIRVLSALCDQPWATTPQVLTMLLDIVERHIEGSPLDALQSKDGQPLRNTGGRVEMRGDTAIIGITGPLFRYANLMTDCSGATSCEMLSKDFQKAVESPMVRQIVLDINSPGGEADGIGELAGQIYKARALKPVLAYVGGMAASGGYWLASAAQKIVLHETGQAGSIGVVATQTDHSQALEKAGIRRYEIVSSQSPDKRQAPGSDAAKALVQTTVDDLADVFISRVAQYRGVSKEHVIEHFGRGYTKMGQRAISAGMADEFGSLEGLLAGVNQEVSMDESTVRTEERGRVSAILDSEEAKNRGKLARHLALKTTLSPEEAKSILASSEEESKPSVFVEAMQQVANPVVGPARTESLTEEEEYEKEVQAILEYVPATNRRRVQ